MSGFPPASSAASGILGVTAYNPGTISTYTTTSTTSADVDSTNLTVTFAAPTSGRVLVRLVAIGGVSAATNQMYWEVREGAAVISTDNQVAALTTNILVGAVFVISGVTAGTHTYKWGFRVNGAITGSMFAGGVAGPATMEVWAA